MEMIKFNEQEKIDSVNGALALRPQINEIVDEICERGYSNICWLGVGGTWASAMQATVHMKEMSAIETWAENAAEYCHKGDLLGVKGRIQSRSIETEEDQKRTVMELIAEKVTYLSSKNKD